MTSKRFAWLTALLIILALAVAACAGGQAPSTEQQAPAQEEALKAKVLWRLAI